MRQVGPGCEFLKLNLVYFVWKKKLELNSTVFQNIVKNKVTADWVKIIPILYTPGHMFGNWKLFKFHFNSILLTFIEQKITDTDIIKLLSDEEISLLVPSIGDRIRLKRGIKCLDNETSCPPREIQTADNVSINVTLYIIPTKCLKKNYTW